MEHFEGMRAALWSWFLVGQKATLGIGACLLGAASVFQCHGVLLLRNRPLGLRCGAALKAWELHFGVGFLSVQKATLLSTRRFHPSGPWCFAVSQPPARTSLWSCFEGMGAAPAAPPAAAGAAAGPAAELALFYQNPEGTSSLGAACFWRSFRPSVAWCFGVAKGAFWRLAAPAPAAPPAAAGAAAAAGPAAELALFLPESRRDVKSPGSMFFGGRSVLQ